MSGVELSIALGPGAATRALRDGSAVPRGVRLDFIDVVPIIAAFRRMVRDLEFDVCELAPTTYLAAREAGVPIIALPVFLTRRFHHGDIVCRPDSGITAPKDLEGRRVGVRAYSVSTGVWLRGILESEYGVDLTSITWVVDDEEHVSSLPLPVNVERTAPGDSIAGQVARGEIDAGLTGAAGIGRTGAPTAGWSVTGAGFAEGRRGSAEFYPLFPDADALEADWYRRTGIYPIHALIAVRAGVLDAHPEVAAALWGAFAEAKTQFLKELPAAAGGGAEHVRYRAMQAIVGDDPIPYGVQANRATLEALCDYATRQHLVRRRPEPEQLFAFNG